jgi:hypothetical protein
MPLGTSCATTVTVGLLHALPLLAAIGLEVPFSRPR